MLRRLGALALVSAASATPAFAQTVFTSNGSQCGGNEFLTCANVSASYSQATSTLLVSIMNSSPNTGSVFTSWGFGNLSATYTYTLQSYSGGAWTLDQDISNSIQSFTSGESFGASPVPPPVDNGIMQGQTVLFTFTLAGSPTLAGVTSAFSEAQFVVHDQGGSPVGAGCAASTKLVIGNGGTKVNSPSCLPPSTVPEPATLALLGTGLLGLMGGSLVRRRQLDV